MSQDNQKIRLIVFIAEGAALPLAALTAVVGLYSSIKLDLPQPWSPATKPTPLLIYGASSAVGYYALQFAIRSDLHPLICIAGRASAHVEKLLDKSKGDAVVDYRGCTQIQPICFAIQLPC